MQEKEAYLHNILEELHDSSDEIGGTALIQTDGFLISSTLPPSLDAETIGAITTSTMKISHESIKEFNRKEVKQVLVKGKQGFIILRNINEHIMLVVLASHKIKLGVLFLGIKKIAAKIEEALKF